MDGGRPDDEGERRTGGGPSRRRLLRTAASAGLASIVGASGVGTAGTATTDDVRFAEDFEDHAPGTVPGAFVLAGGTDQEVVDAAAPQGDRAYRMSGSHGGCWRALARVPVEFPDRFVVRGFYRLEGGEIGCHDGSGGVRLRTVASESWSDGSGTGLLRFHPDGTVTSRGTTVGTHTPGEWTSFRVAYVRDSDRGTVTYECRVDGGETVTVERDEHDAEDDYSALELVSDDFTVLWDELVVSTETADEPEEPTDPPEPTGPTADFTYEPIDAVPGDSVTFTADGSEPGDAPIETYEWRFGESGEFEALGPRATLEVETAGTRSVTLRVTDSNGHSDTATADVTFSEPESPAFAVDVDPVTDPVAVGDGIDLEVAIANEGEVDDARLLAISVEGETVLTDTVTLDAGDATTLTYDDCYEVTAADAPTVEATAIVEDGPTASTTVSVTDPEEEEGDDEGPVDDDTEDDTRDDLSDDSTREEERTDGSEDGSDADDGDSEVVYEVPGFGIGSAVTGVGSAAYLLSRRLEQDGD